MISLFLYDSKFTRPMLCKGMQHLPLRERIKRFKSAYIERYGVKPEHFEEVQTYEREFQLRVTYQLRESLSKEDRKNMQDYLKERFKKD